MASRRIWRLSLPLSACVVALTCALTAPNAHGRPAPSSRSQARGLEPTSPPPGYVPPVVASLRLRPVGSALEYWVKATENAYALHTCPTRLTFAVGSGHRRHMIFRYKSCERLVYMFLPEASESVLVTVWEGGSAVWVRAFRIEGESVSLVFDRAARSQPEFPWDSILLNVGEVAEPNGSYEPRRTEIWTWTGEKYKLAATVSFPRRYDALQGLPPSAWR